MKSEKANILLVDDKASNIFALQQALNHPSRNFLTASSGKEALKMVLNNEIDLIILDVQMPGMDGFEVAQILKSNKRTRDIPIIFASAEKKEQKFMLKGFEEGAVDYLHKPLDMELTEAKVAVLLKLQLQRKELIEKNFILEKYALLINNSADLICIIHPETLKFEEVNEAANVLLGYTVEELRHKSLLHYVTEEHRPKVRKLGQEAREQFSFETQVYHKNRSIKWLNWNVVSRNGLWFANARDITEAKEVQEIKHYLAAVVMQSNEAIYLHNPEGKIIAWNEGAEKIYGFTETEALDMNIWNIVPSYLLNEAQDVVMCILRGEQIQSLETKRITKYGRIIDVVFSASVITDTENNLKSVAITERDITQDKKSELEIRQLNSDLAQNIERLEEANLELESFSYSVSHDLRAPLRAINGYAKIIEEEYGKQLDEELRHLFDIIRGNARRMGMLIDDLLAFSKLGRKEVAKADIDMNALALAALHEIEMAAAHKAKVMIEPLPSAHGDRSLISQVLLNLISNGIKYSSKKAQPEVCIGATDQELETTYYVKDNGSGFSMDYADKLFGVFQRLHRVEEFEGTGVGLAIVKRIVTKHGGRVWAEAEPDKGATFYFTLPKGEVMEESRKAEVSSFSQHPGGDA